MSENTEEQTELTEDQKNNKVEKKFTAALTRLVAVVGGQAKLKISKKTPKDELGSVVDELFKEERESVLKETKEKLRGLLKQYAEMESALKQKQQEFEKLQKQKKEEFTKAAEALFNQIEGVADVEKSYYSALKVATGE